MGEKKTEIYSPPVVIFLSYPGVVAPKRHDFNLFLEYY